MKAADCQCNVCGKAAVAFWPAIDPDIDSLPYCRKCLDATKYKLLNELLLMKSTRLTKKEAE